MRDNFLDRDKDIYFGKWCCGHHLVYDFVNLDPSDSVYDLETGCIGDWRTMIFYRVILAIWSKARSSKKAFVLLKDRKSDQYFVPRIEIETNGGIKIWFDRKRNVIEASQLRSTKYNWVRRSKYFKRASAEAKELLEVKSL